MSNIRDKIISKFGTGYKQKGHEYLYLCPNPLHNDSRVGSFRVNSNTGQFHCFACGFKGTVLSSKDYYNNTLSSPAIQKEKEKIWLTKEKQEHNPRAYNRFKNYINNRGINPNLVDDFNIQITGWGKEDSYSCGVVIGENSVYKYTLDINNKLIIKDNTKLKMWVKNSDAIPLILFPKIFNSNDGVDFYIFEGIEDMFAFYQLSKNADYMQIEKSCFVCLFGIYNINKLHIELLAKNNSTNKFYWGCDGDKASQEQYDKTYRKITSQLINLNKILEKNNVKDFNELLLKITLDNK